MVMSFLMGWGDVYQSHHYTSVYWSSFISTLIKAHPDLLQHQTHKIKVSDEDNHNNSPEELDHGQDHESPLSEESMIDKENSNDESEENDEMVFLELDKKGKLYIKSQVIDYRYRGEGLETYNVYDFFQNTWHTNKYSKGSYATIPL